ncbi:MAG: energy transducer TonB [Sneathiella sp.]|nr:energy transducer TonB [Sneathiella sp.]
MVRAHSIDIGNFARWSGLLALSLMVNIYALAYFNISPKVIDFPSVERIKVTILSIAAPVLEPVIIPTKKTRPQPKIIQARKPITSKIIVKEQAPEKIVLLKPKKLVQRLQTVPTPRLILHKPVLQKPVQETSKTIQKPLPEVKQAIKSPPKSAFEPVTPAKTQTRSVALETPIAPGKGRDASTVIHNANYRKRTAPRYPRRAFELGQQGIVTLAALILPNGHPQSLKIEISSGHRLLDKAALSAVKRWEFEPLVRNGQKIQSWVRVPVRFVIN